MEDGEKVVFADFRNEAYFPKFKQLPSVNCADNDYSIRAGTPRKHWCFFAEVIPTKHRPWLRRMSDIIVPIRDKAGDEMHVYTHADELVRMGVQPGQTIAILYAKTDEICGPKTVKEVRTNEYTSGIKVIPISLDRLFELNGRVCSFSNVQDGRKICYGCGKEVSEPRKCSKCSIFWYCNMECEQRGQKNHEVDCKILQDPDVRAMYHLDWDKCEWIFQFSAQSGELDGSLHGYRLCSATHSATSRDI